MTDSPGHDIHDANFVASMVAADSFPSSRNIGIKNPHPHDVLCGRGGMAINHIGNVHYRTIVEANKRLYHKVEKFEKMLVALSIVQVIQRQSPPGRFLAKLSSNRGDELWYDIGDAKARDKTSQALREGASEVRLTMKYEEEGGELRDLTSSPSQCEADEISSGVMSPPGSSHAEAECSFLAPPNRGGKDPFGSTRDEEEKTGALSLGSVPGSSDAPPRQGSPAKKRAKSHKNTTVDPIVDAMMQSHKEKPLPEPASNFDVWAANIGSTARRDRHQHKRGHSPSQSQASKTLSATDHPGFFLMNSSQHEETFSSASQSLIDDLRPTPSSLSTRIDASERALVVDEEDSERSHSNIGVETHLMRPLQLPETAQNIETGSIPQKPSAFNTDVLDPFSRVESVFHNQPPLSPQAVTTNRPSRLQPANSGIHPALLLRNFSVETMPQFVRTASSSIHKSNLSCSSDTIAAGIADFLQQQIEEPLDARTISQGGKNVGPIGPLSDWELMLLQELREAGDEDEQGSNKGDRSKTSAHQRRPSGGGWDFDESHDNNTPESMARQPRRHLAPPSAAIGTSWDLERRSSAVIDSVHGIDATADRATHDGDSSPDFSNFTVTSSVFDDEFNLEDESSAYTLPERNFLGGSGNNLGSIGLISVV